MRPLCLYTTPLLVRLKIPSRPNPPNSPVSFHHRQPLFLQSFTQSSSFSFSSSTLSVPPSFTFHSLVAIPSFSFSVNRQRHHLHPLSVILMCNRFRSSGSCCSKRSYDAHKYTSRGLYLHPIHSIDTRLIYRYQKVGCFVWYIHVRLGFDARGYSVKREFCVEAADSRISLF